MSANASVDAVLRRYLLGTLAPEVQDSVERRLFSEDDIFWEQLSLAEDELIDDYVHEKLDERDAASFENRFLSTHDRRERLTFARALKACVNRERTEAKPDSRLLRTGLATPPWAAAVAVLLIVVLPAAAWRLSRPAGQAAAIDVWLSSGLVRSVGQNVERLQIPESSPLVRLHLEVPGRDFERYRATLHAADGEEIWSQASLAAVALDRRTAVTVTLPAELLPVGDYFVRLQGLHPSQEPAPLGRYDFRVLR